MDLRYGWSSAEQFHGVVSPRDLNAKGVLGCDRSTKILAMAALNCAAFSYPSVVERRIRQLDIKLLTPAQLGEAVFTEVCGQSATESEIEIKLKMFSRFPAREVGQPPICSKELATAGIVLSNTEGTSIEGAELALRRLFQECICRAVAITAERQPNLLFLTRSTESMTFHGPVSDYTPWRSELSLPVIKKAALSFEVKYHGMVSAEPKVLISGAIRIMATKPCSTGQGFELVDVLH